MRSNFTLSVIEEIFDKKFTQQQRQRFFTTFKGETEMKSSSKLVPQQIPELDLEEIGLNDIDEEILEELPDSYHPTTKRSFSYTKLNTEEIEEDIQEENRSIFSPRQSPTTVLAFTALDIAKKLNAEKKQVVKEYADDFVDDAIPQKFTTAPNVNYRRLTLLPPPVINKNITVSDEQIKHNIDIAQAEGIRGNKMPGGCSI